MRQALSSIGFLKVFSKGLRYNGFPVHVIIHNMNTRKYGFNIKSQLLKLFVIFPAVSALAAWICTLF